jgi:hypothetical protein
MSKKLALKIIIFTTVPIWFLPYALGVLLWIIASCVWEDISDRVDNYYMK